MDLPKKVKLRGGYVDVPAEKVEEAGLLRQERDGVMPAQEAGTPVLMTKSGRGDPWSASSSLLARVRRHRGEGVRKP
jgi:hypothetical protein